MIRFQSDFGFLYLYILVKSPLIKCPFFRGDITSLRPDKIRRDFFRYIVIYIMPYFLGQSSVIF